MLSKILMALLAAGSLSVPAVADDDYDDEDSAVAVCHRTGGRAVQGLFPGHVIVVSGSAVRQHVDRHADVVLLPATVEHFSRKKPVCLVDGPGNVFTQDKQLVQPVAQPDTGGDPGGPQ